jgi:hypothetical protein
MNTTTGTLYSDCETKKKGGLGGSPPLLEQEHCIGVVKKKKKRGVGGVSPHHEQDHSETS